MIKIPTPNYKPSVPEPPKKPLSQTYTSIASHEDEEWDAMPKLKRDDKASVNKTLKRLKHSQVTTIETSEGQKKIRAASGLVSERDVSKLRSFKKTIIILVILIFATVLAIASLNSNVIDSLNLPSSPQTSVEGYLLATPQSDIEEIILATPVVTIAFTEGEMKTRQESITQIFAALGFEFSQAIAISAQSLPALYSNQSSNEFVFGFYTSDTPLTSRDLRLWENDVAKISALLVPNPIFSTTIDQQLGGNNYRVLNNSVSYTISDDGLVLIGSNPQTIDNQASKIRTSINNAIQKTR